ncbi:SDR family oxidoreductase [Treponema sp. OttesenSCG-928-L16]|nr:SDR family oxidoreductase [Treponema sp. OttesenSCG-928-L16]
MKVFITGGTGFIGTVVVQKLKAAGHQILGLARSDESAEKLKAVGAEVIRGATTDLDVLKEGAESADGVIHLAFDSDFSRYAAAIAEDLAAIRTIGAALEGTNKPFVGTSGTLMVSSLGRPATEMDPAVPGTPRGDAENEVIALAQKGIRSSIVRLAPSVHDTRMQGLVTILSGIAREKKVSAYIGDGSKLWPAVYMPDAAELFCKALESASAGTRLHAAAEEGIPAKDIAEAIGRGLNIPVVSLSDEEAKEHFGLSYTFLLYDNPTSSALTKEWVGWHPSQRTLADDLKEALGK